MGGIRWQVRCSKYSTYPRLGTSTHWLYLQFREVQYLSSRVSPVVTVRCPARSLVAL